MAAKKKTESKARERRSNLQRITELKRQIKLLEDREATRALKSEPVFKHLKAVRSNLEKAVGQMDGRTSKLEADFIRASRQYLNLLGRALDEITGKKRRGRKPKTDLE
ncbi:MAG: hypothetical protein ACE5F1_09965 [Planctomycetota bacterium]